MKLRPDAATEADLPLVFGRYELTRLLGEGGSARVFEAELRGPEGFRKPVALKVIRYSIVRRGPHLRRALVREARVGGLLSHPNVVATHDFGEVDGQPWIALELVRGVPLDHALRRGPPPPAVALEIAAQVCAGLAHAHGLEHVDVHGHVVHRDLKPSNVLLSRDGQAKVMDFGVAKASSMPGTTETGLAKGTPAYMAPEQVNGDAVDPRTDLFAVGLLLAELVTGERVFAGETLMSVMTAVVRVEDRVRRSGLLERLDGAVLGLGPVVGRCLRRDPENRWPDAAQLERALRALASEGPRVDLKAWVRDLEASPGPAGGASRRSPPSVRRMGPEGSGAPVAKQPAPGPGRPVPATRQQPAVRRRSVAPLMGLLGLLLTAMVLVALAPSWVGLGPAGGVLGPSAGPARGSASSRAGGEEARSGAGEADIAGADSAASAPPTPSLSGSSLQPGRSGAVSRPRSSGEDRARPPAEAVQDDAPRGPSGSVASDRGGQPTPDDRPLALTAAEAARLVPGPSGAPATGASGAGSTAAAPEEGPGRLAEGAQLLRGSVASVHAVAGWKQLSIRTEVLGDGDPDLRAFVDVGDGWQQVELTVRLDGGASGTVDIPGDASGTARWYISASDGELRDEAGSREAPRAIDF